MVLYEEAGIEWIRPKILFSLFDSLEWGINLRYRHKNTQTPGQALLKIEGVNDRAAAQYYFGKRVAHVYKAANTVNGTKFRVNWFLLKLGQEVLLWFE